MSFDVILADPPWFYNKRSNKSKFGLGANQYDLMKTGDICKLDVSSVSSKDSLLFLWVTGPRLEEGLRVMKDWGYKYITIAFCWVKSNKNNNNPFFGIGYYTKSNCELILLGKKGKTIRPDTNSVSQVIDWRSIFNDIPVTESKLQEHSRKPDEIHERIEKMFPNSSKLELFGRRAREGWVVLGNEINGKTIEEELKCLKD